MPLYLPTSKSFTGTLDYFEAYVKKGQLYNLDDDRKVWFQFNPRNFEWSRVIKWTDQSFIGAPSIHHQYLGRGQREFELTLLYIGDFGMPEVEIKNTRHDIKPGDVEVDFDELVREIDAWTEEREDYGRPSFIGIYIANEEFRGFIRDIKKRVIDQYKDQSTRRGEVTIRFQEWEVV